MITKKRYVLLAHSQSTLERACKYEAIEKIDSEKQARDVWRRNKMPVALEGEVTISGDFPTLLIPESEIFGNNGDGFVNWSHENGFECGEFSTGEVIDTATEDCFLCRIGNLEGSNKPLWVYNKNVLRETDMIVYESPHFFVVPEYGAIVRGFLMICPKEHILSMAELPNGYFAEMYQTERDIEAILKGTYGQQKTVSFFEHGSSPDGKSSHKRSVVHAHTHVAIGFEMEKEYLDMVCAQKCNDIRLAKGGKYFSYKAGADGQLHLANDPRVYIQRQYPRQIMAEEIGLAPDQYNWRKNAFSENISATIYRIYFYLKTHWQNLPERIRENTKDFVRGYEAREKS